MPMREQGINENIKAGYTAAFWRDSDADGIQTNSGIIDDDGSLYMSGCPLRER